MYANSRAAAVFAAGRRSVAEAEPAEPVRRGGRRFEPSRRVALIAGLAVVIFGCGLYLSGFVAFTLSLGPRSTLPMDGTTAFARSLTGEIVFEPRDGNICRKVLFYNRSGNFGPDQQVRCDNRSDEPTASVSNGGSRLMSLRDAFIHR